ncbi:MAG: hypothetical protein K5880_13965 [Hydrogenophaga sp.]|uniref:hypothetical protein n=1 Tax=Hydrogenophaga sp. TaxID=1904254 RepID=UPI00262DEDF4|nr:hypothetical protein [Hydrogenophaga sp.]MCV0439728.1 hypothetical protein [Hydrogenophaga sp.]
MKYRTTLTAKAELLKPNTEEFRAVASSLQDSYGFELQPQMDLLYVRSCLVSAGDGVGVNDNDDVFTREEAWAARQTPVLKPFNWQHKDTDIVGVMYTVQARSVDGDILDITDETAPDCDFDLYVEAAIFRLIHEDRAAEIEARANGGSLYVSMEAWFDDYSYGFFDKDTGLQKTVSRTQDTSFLDKHLRASGGTGVYRDPESNQDVRIGRVLRSITFGGCGFVDRPANKRSVIEAAEPMNSFAEQDTELQVEKLLKMVLDSQGEIVTEEVTLMNTQASSQGVGPEEVTAAVDSALDKREKAAAEAQAKATMEARATAAEAKSDELEAKVAELTEAKEAKDAEVQALQTQMDEYGEAVNQLVQEQTAAGATDDTPAEIAAIDSASDGAAAFTAKLAWLQKSMAGLQERAARADELETQLAEAEAVVREQEVRSLLGESFSEETVEVMVASASALDEDAYQAWRDEKELMVIEMTQAADDKKEKKLPPFMKKGKEGKEEKKDAKAGNPFAALLAQKRADSGMASPDTPPIEPHLINHPGGEGVKSGVGPEGLRTPRHKIAGSAGDDPAQILEDAQEVSGVSLAGSQAGDDGVSVSPFRVLANVVTDADESEDDEASAEKPGFDPVN